MIFKSNETLIILYTNYKLRLLSLTLYKHYYLYCTLIKLFKPHTINIRKGIGNKKKIRSPQSYISRTPSSPSGLINVGNLCVYVPRYYTH